MFSQLVITKLVFAIGFRSGIRGLRMYGRGLGVRFIKDDNFVNPPSEAFLGPWRNRL